MKNIDSRGHVTGKSTYLDDIRTMQGCLHAAVFVSDVAHARITHIDYQEAEQQEGVVRIFKHTDVLGENQIGGIIEDEPLLAENEVHFHGQPIAFVVASSEFLARQAVKHIHVTYEELPIITDPREAAANDSLLFAPRTFALGDTATAWEQCEYVVEGIAENGGQEHLYIETQGAYAYPQDNGSIKVHSSTQGPTAVQMTLAKLLAIPMHQIEVDVVRLGGGFGGKEDQASGWAGMAALAAYVLQKPVKFALPRHNDMQTTGKRHPYSSDFKIGLSKDLKIIAFDVDYYQNGGAATDLSPAILERTLFHATNSYFIPNVKATAYSCRTNLPPNTAFRGFGAPQAVFVIEAAIAKAADQINVPATQIQKENLLKEQDEFPFGQIATQVNSHQSWDAAASEFQLDEWQQKVNDFNATNAVFKKGISVQPIAFGISFTKTSLNQARALVHIYQDGSVGVSTGAIEMGQSVNTKMIQVAAQQFAISVDRIKLESTNTTRVANSSPTAASYGDDLNGKALETACLALKKRLLGVASEMLDATNNEKIELKDGRVYVDSKSTELTWNELVFATYEKRISISEIGHYSTPIIHFDMSKEKGHPFAYHVYGTAITCATVDCIRGTYEIDAVKIVHDFGKSMNLRIDKGQVEGAVAQGVGWMTLEDLQYDKQGRMLSSNLSTYKVPDIMGAPKVMEVSALETEGAELAILKSKAVGEPPFVYGIGAYFAIQNAIKAFNPNHKRHFVAPLTPEKLLLGLYKG